MIETHTFYAYLIKVFNRVQHHYLYKLYYI